MPGKLLTTASSLSCPHGGRAVLMTANARVKAGGPRVLLESDVHTVTGCSYTEGNKPSPCVRISWSSGAGKASLDSTPPLVETSIGSCRNAQNGEQGLALVAGTQQKARAQ